MFITLEGGEGVGKSTNLAFVENWLVKQGFDVVVTREPGGTPMAEEIRELMLHHREETVHPTTELLLAFAARAQHVEGLIKPALADGKTVLSDRFTDATYAYQGMGRGISKEMIHKLEVLSINALQPDLTIFLDADPKIGMARASSRSELDRIEIENMKFFDDVRQGYLDRAKEHPDRFQVIDAEKPLEQVQEQILQVLESCVG